MSSSKQKAAPTGKKPNASTQIKNTGWFTLGEPYPTKKQSKTAKTAK